MVDLHTHIIPGVDDGSDNMEDSMEMARMSVGSGVSVIVATPHSNIEQYYENYSSPMLFQGMEELNRRIRRENLPLKVVPGMEIYATEDVAEKIAQKKLISLNGSRYYLIEFPFDVSPRWMSGILEEVKRLKGVVPVIAHPERYYCVQARPERVWEWVMRGFLTQINKGSLFGKFGPEAFRVCMDLMEYNLVTCVASDAHTPYSRTTFMGEAKEFLTEEYSAAYARLVLEEQPGRIVENRTVEMRACARSILKKHAWNER